MQAGEAVGLAGTSGSGKTTFLNVVAGILRADSGRVLFEGTDLTRLSEAARDSLRARSMGYVFQSFHLLEGYTALENVLLGMLFGPGPDKAFAVELLDRLGLGARRRHRPSQLSVGQQQRVALARALANRPRLVLADEPTGNLDPRSAREALHLIRELCAEQGAALLLVSHDPGVLQSFERVVDFAELNAPAAAGLGPGDRA
jgi:putative ABC transport system ATP-binding protein